MDPDQAQLFVEPDQGPKCLKGLLPNKTFVCNKIRFSRDEAVLDTYSLNEHFGIPDQAQHFINIVSEYDQEILQSQTANKPMAI